MNDYVKTRLLLAEDFLKDLKEINENEMLKFDCAIYTCKCIIMNVEEIMRTCEELHLKEVLNKKGPF